MCFVAASFIPPLQMIIDFAYSGLFYLIGTILGKIGNDDILFVTLIMLLLCAAIYLVFNYRIIKGIVFLIVLFLTSGVVIYLGPLFISNEFVLLYLIRPCVLLFLGLGLILLDKVVEVYRRTKNEALKS